ncbi:SagB/ThcOx family dehydrogenase [Streptomyces camelliae]|uniref:SagB/ThcOx family dehydrogenase n=1 Tax=Streptomyces camelliae TaxID=3004093 RepID=A0ABY7P6I1_9ACTN|nr:SagB/ThcOx family dehydrogenase [Streptomyces sp. HUAS 2-6]WBO65134.1 SagB/ThcOx family dehydrogenase [Streptomyces sp. HUAS 2-6]
MVCDDPVLHRQLALSPGAQRLLARFADWTEVAESDDSGADPELRLVHQLHAARILIAEESPEDRLVRSLGAWSEWGTAATYFHLSSRTTCDEKFLSAAEDSARLISELEERPQPPETKEYPEAPRIRLSAPQNDRLAERGLDSVLRARRTTRRFDRESPVTEAQLATLLHWVAAPQHQVKRPGMVPAMLKASPSGGARHSLEVYPVVLNVEGVPSGVYHYHSTEHVLESLVPGPVDPDRVVEWCGDQTYLHGAGVVFFYTSVLDRVAWKYRTGRTYRTLFMELGHFSQTAYLVGTALDLGVFFTAATRDAAVEELLGLDWRREILCGVTGVGVPTPEESSRQRAMLAGAEPDFSFFGDSWDGRGQ